MAQSENAQNPDQRLQLRAWALYDWGNSAFSTTVMAAYFPVFFKQYWSAGAPVSVSTFHLGVANSSASLIVALSSPLLGAIADKGRLKKRLLAIYAALGVAMTAGLFLVPKGDWSLAALCYAAATVGFSGSLVFYDSLLLSVARPEDTDRASSLGYALGYLGGGLLYAINIAMVWKPELFGLHDRGDAVRYSFLSVAVWWGVFTLPLLRYVREPRAAAMPLGAAMRGGVRELVGTLRRVAGMRTLRGFLLAYWLYIDGVDTVVTMSVDYGLSIGLKPLSLTVALAITQFIGFPAAIAFGRLAGVIGTRRAILVGIAVYVAVTYFGYRMQGETEFYLLAGTIGLVQGGVQALSRAFYSRLIPPAEAAEFFGFYNMLGKFAAIIGPALMGTVSLVTGNQRLSILSLSLLLVLGGALLWRVDERAASTQAGFSR